MSGNVEDMTGQNRDFSKLLETVQSLQSSSKASHSGGGGDGGDVIERVAKLEAGVEHLQSDMTDVKTGINAIRNDVSNLKERMAALEVKVDHLPTRGQTRGDLVLLLALIAALVTFQGQIQDFVSPPDPPIAAIE